MPELTFNWAPPEQRQAVPGCDCAQCRDARLGRAWGYSTAPIATVQPTEQYLREVRTMRGALQFLRALRRWNHPFADNYTRDRNLREAWRESRDEDADRFAQVVREVAGHYVDQCEDCGRPTVDTRDVGGDLVCMSCIESNYGWCDNCDTYYHYDHSSEHDHSDGPSECEPAGKFHFAIPNVPASGVIRSGERTTLTCQGGRISPEAFEEVVCYLRELFYSAAISDAQWNCYVNNVYYHRHEGHWSEWQTADGNWTKRLAKVFLQNGLKLDKVHLAEIGNRVRRHTSAKSEIEIEITRDLNQSASYFYHSDSCWWGGYYQSMCHLKQLHGFAIRTFDSLSGQLNGRAWVIPLTRTDRDWTDCADAEKCDGYMLFNPYGPDGYEFARILAQLTGMTYKKIAFGLGSDSYVNGNKGFLISSAEHCAATLVVTFDRARECSC